MPLWHNGLCFPNIYKCLKDSLSMLKSYPKFKRREIEEVYKKLPEKEKQIIEKYLEYRKARGITSEQKVADLRRYIIQARKILDKNFDDITLDDLRKFLAILNSSYLSDYTKNNLKIDIRNFLKWKIKKWSDRFNDLEDIKISNSRNENKINPSILLKSKDIERVMKHETRMFWKSFFITQYEGGLRTIEVRNIKWDDIAFNVDGDISSINIYASKTKKARTIFIKEATFYLKRLKEQQENIEQKGIYVFHSKKDVNKPIDKGTISSWMRSLSERALGRKIWSYILRHSRATELYRLAKQGR